jgi:PPE-repeat protein
MKKIVKGWKIFDKDLKCRGYQFKIGKTFKQDGLPVLCTNGFHFHENPKDLFEYYALISENRVCEVEATNVITGEDKSVCSKIKIIKELTWVEIYALINMGECNTGRLNTGDMNTGNWNTGHRNTGDMNTGDMNTGHMNTGHLNTGHMNTGDMNTGHRNTGHMNTGDMNTGRRNTGRRNRGNWNTGRRNRGNWNTGDWNSTDFSAGIFNTKEQLTPIFNGAAMVLMSEFRNTDNYQALFDAILPIDEWIYESDMTEEEKQAHPTFYVQKGYLKVRSFKDACAIWWKNTSDRAKRLIQDIEGFDKEIFKEVTGIEI